MGSQRSKPQPNIQSGVIAPMNFGGFDGFDVVVDDSIPPGTVDFVSDGKVIGRLKNIRINGDPSFKQLVENRVKQTFWRIK